MKCGKIWPLIYIIFIFSVLKNFKGERNSTETEKNYFYEEKKGNPSICVDVYNTRDGCLSVNQEIVSEKVWSKFIFRKKP